MKKVSQNKQSVAWFKLAECVDRGEKEKALSFFRLLTHSYNELAFIKKLEADILTFFQDSNADNSYEEAALLYAKAGKLFEAALIYEHLLLESPHNTLYKAKTIEFFYNSGHQVKAASYDHW